MTKDQLRTALDMIEEHELEGAQILVHPSFWGSICSVSKVIEPMFEIEYYIDEAHWPEWKVVVAADSSDEIIVKASNATIAREKAEKVKYGTCIT